MLQINAHVTWRVRRSCGDGGMILELDPPSDTIQLDELDTDNTDLVAVRIYRWMVNLGCRLPIGVTL